MGIGSEFQVDGAETQKSDKKKLFVTTDDSIFNSLFTVST